MLKCELFQGSKKGVMFENFMTKYNWFLVINICGYRPERRQAYITIITHKVTTTDTMLVVAQCHRTILIALMSVGYHCMINERGGTSDYKKDLNITSRVHIEGAMA